MGKTEVVDGVVRGPKPASVRRERGWVPPWEGPTRNEFHVRWDQRKYGFVLESGAVNVLQEEWNIDYKTVPPTATSVSGSLELPSNTIQMTYDEVCRLVEHCRETGDSMRRAFAKTYHVKLNGEQKVLLAHAPEIFVKHEPRTSLEQMVESPKTEEFWNSL